MRSHGSSPHWGQRRGFTLAEMLVTMVITSIVIAGGVSVFLTMQRAREQQAAVQDIQAEAHSVVEQLVRLVRNADSVATSSTDSRLEVIGGITQIACDAPVCWIEASSADGLRIGPEGGPGRLLARSVTGVEFLYGLDPDGNGKVDCGGTPTTNCFGPPGSKAEDILGVLMRLHFSAEHVRGQFEETVVVHAALRSRVLERIKF